MARLAEVRVAPAEPLSYGTTELALVFYEIHSVHFAIFHASTYTYCRAFSANQFFFFEILIVILRRLAVLHASEVRLVALVALVVRKPLHRVALQVIEERIARLLQSRLLVQILELCSFHCLL